MKHVLLSTLLFLTACGGLSAHTHALPIGASRSPECVSLEARYDVWGAVATAAAVVSAGSTLGAFDTNEADLTGRRVLAGLSLVAAVASGVSIFMRDQSTKEYGEECEARAAASTPAHASSVPEREPRCVNSPYGEICTRVQK